MIDLGIAKPKDKTRLKDESFELEIEEDRARLMVQGLGMLVLNVALLFAAAGAWAAANVTGNVFLLIAVLIILAVVWFISKGMGWRVNRFVSGVHAVDFGSKDIFIYEKSDPKKALVVPYKNVRSYKCIRQGRSLRLLLSGDWVEHPSGFQLIDICRPFCSASLADVQSDVEGVMEAHCVRECS